MFLELIKAGLWGKDSFKLELPENCSRSSQKQALATEGVDWDAVYQLTREQSVIGLLAAGIDSLPMEVRPPQEIKLQMIGEALQIEQRNKTMNEFIGTLFRRLSAEGIHAVLVKGQGVAQCYERPLWRASGDVDLLLDEENYQKAKEFLKRYGVVDSENVWNMHTAMTVKSWIVELHGKMPFALSRRADDVVDEVIRKSLCDRQNTGDGDLKDVYIPGADEHVFLVFTHFLHHFFIEGVGLRQICDWCRMLWTYRDSLDYGLLEERIRRAGLKSEWKAFASLAVDYLGMPEGAMPFYEARLNAKGGKVLRRVMKSGNFGHNNDLSYRSKYKGMTYKVVATWRRFVDFVLLIPVFPVDAPRFFVTYIRNKTK